MTQNYNYPDSKTQLLQAYGGQYEACYIILHPFRIFNDDIDDDVPDQAELISWHEVMDKTGIQTIEQVNAALLTEIALEEEAGFEADPQNLVTMAILQQLAAQTEGWELPAEGVFDEFYYAKFIEMFKFLGHHSALACSQFPDANETGISWDMSLDDFPEQGSIYSENSELLLTVDADSFFTLAYSTQKNLELFIRKFGFEGFFADENTKHGWAGA